jgi:hypothetical protein
VSKVSEVEAAQVSKLKPKAAKEKALLQVQGAVAQQELVAQPETAAVTEVRASLDHQDATHYTRYFSHPDTLFHHIQSLPSPHYTASWGTLHPPVPFHPPLTREARIGLPSTTAVPTTSFG